MTCTVRKTGFLLRPAKLTHQYLLSSKGQLPDLLHILETSGLPSKRNKYIFNGDFVDRGSYGVEVMCSLLALHIALPGKCDLPFYSNVSVLGSSLSSPYSSVP